MKLFWKFAASTLLVLTILSNPAVANPSKEDVIARVFDVSGKGLEVKRNGKNDWEKGKKDSAGFIRDHFKTDAKTSAALELLIGARLGVKPGTEIVLLDEDEAGQVMGDKKVRKIALNSGSVYAKFNKQETPLKIQTRGGVMGIKGTEFEVETADNGETSVMLLEGSVDYEEKDGKTSELVPGQKLRQFEKDGELHTVKGEPSEVDKVVADILSGAIPLANINSVQDVLNTNWTQLPENSVNTIINNSRHQIMKDIPGPIANVVNSFVPGTVVNFTNVNFYIPSPRVPGIGPIRF